MRRAGREPCARRPTAGRVRLDATKPSVAERPRPQGFASATTVVPIGGLSGPKAERRQRAGVDREGGEAAPAIEPRDRRTGGAPVGEDDLGRAIREVRGARHHAAGSEDRAAPPRAASQPDDARPDLCRGTRRMSSP